MVMDGKQAEPGTLAHAPLPESAPCPLIGREAPSRVGVFGKHTQECRIQFSRHRAFEHVRNDVPANSKSQRVSYKGSPRYAVCTDVGVYAHICQSAQLSDGVRH